MREDLISIIVPVYNSEKYIEQCITSVLNQCYKKIELILIDDGSTDLSGQICDTYAKKDKRVVVIHQTNQGVSKARNKGVEVSKGNWIMFVDSDDWIDSQLLSKVGKYLSGEYDIVFFGYRETFVNQTVNKAVGSKNSVLLADELNLLILKNINKNFKLDRSLEGIKVSVPWGKVIKKELLTKNDIHFIPDLYGEDMVYNLYCFKYASKAFFISEAMYNYRQRQVSLYNGYRENIEKDLEYQFDQIQEFVSEYKSEELYNRALRARKMINYMYIVLKDICNCDNTQKLKIKKNRLKSLTIEENSLDGEVLKDFPIKEKILLYFIKYKKYVLIKCLVFGQTLLEKKGERRKKFV